ncbi:DUF2635 domain-containing protein [Vibrio spartinae]|uniref:DUF2635 domain-containing protein n=1 Tax=Vibrio spartinae TaxID=1918945 RepID=A0A1N6M5T1_9VIBR|nr:DUF2635 domain-containing protein [Vibrio spartinae]SIO94792.1 hypothetical protein VSP9026_02522 [Vibrio spartinae]
MIQMIFIKPRDGLTVRKPDGTFLNVAGETVRRNAYWVRRLNDGDVTKSSPASGKTKKEVTNE